MKSFVRLKFFTLNIKKLKHKIFYWIFLYGGLTTHKILRRVYKIKNSAHKTALDGNFDDFTARKCSVMSQFEVISSEINWHHFQTLPNEWKIQHVLRQMHQSLFKEHYAISFRSAWHDNNHATSTRGYLSFIAVSSKLGLVYNFIHSSL